MYRTPFNDRRPPDRRLLVNGRWVRLDPVASNVLARLRAEAQTAVNSNQRPQYGSQGR